MEGSVFFSWLGRLWLRFFVCSWRGHVSVLYDVTDLGRVFRCQRCFRREFMAWPRDLPSGPVIGPRLGDIEELRDDCCGRADT